MASFGPPVLKPFTKTRVVLALELTPVPASEREDLTAIKKTAFRDSSGKEAAGEATGEGAEPQMFKKKTKKERVVPEVPGLAGQLMRTSKKSTAPGAKKVYSRLDVMSRDLQAAELSKLTQALQDMAKGLIDIETSNPYTKLRKQANVFAPLSRRGFGSFIVDQFSSIFPRGAQKALDVAKCAVKGEEGVKEVKIYHYQAFIREYLRFESPYRGLLVYHGLGSGKTCSAIAAAEALFGTRGLKIVVMTPFSLRDNFISEINFCGFKHFRLQNHWTSLSLEPGSNPDPAMVKMFAQSVYGVPQLYLDRLKKGKKELHRIWVPDFEAAPNFDALSPDERDGIKSQLKATIENRITFINYNGVSANDLKTMVCSTPEIFDNAVIVVDEIHNLIRLIQGSLEPYFSNPSGRKRSLPLEILSPERKKLPLCGMTKNYMRGYLFYRLFMDAKNSKIIGLSGTPLINFPEELGILANILHGPIQTIEFTATVEGMRDIQPIIQEIVEAHEDLDTVHFTVNEGSLDVLVRRLPEQFTKIFSESGDLLGIKRLDPGVPVKTLEQIKLSLDALLAGNKIKVSGKGSMKAMELLPSWDTPFRGAFLEVDGITLKDPVVLQKRLRGLISYYRGIQGDVMPTVIKDEIVGVPLTGYSLKIYNKLRNQEIQVEMKKPKAQGSAGDQVWAEINEIATMKSSANYRMSSRQACNFAFPEGVSRPRPNNLEEDDVETGKDRDIIVEADIEDGVAGREEGDDIQEDSEELKAEVQAELPKAEAAGAAPIVRGSREAKAAYQAALKSVRDKLRTMGKTHLQIDAGQSGNTLAKYSPKFDAMLKNINKLSGSSLVYSNFLAMEGIGIFAICMEANGYEPIQIVPGADGRLKFSDRSVTSLMKGPKVPEKRYIEFTGVGSKEQRGAAVDVFNARLDKLSPALQEVLKSAGWTDNFDGGLCRAFCITSAGAEGLSLKCVRGVHIMEPYWNTVRTQQVKGRAVRICSHMDLPKDQQNVEVYTYCSIIPDEAIIAQAIDKTLENSDSYSAEGAKALGVPVPDPIDSTKEIPLGLFEKVEQVEPGAVAEVEESDTGTIMFSPKIDNPYRALSNFAPTPITVGGKLFPTVEHYFQSKKFPDGSQEAENIRVSPTPLKAKQLGSQNQDKMVANWDTEKESVMMTGLMEKFSNNLAAKTFLQSTGDRPLVEDTTDTYWGRGPTGKGKNRMGKLLEQVRLTIKEHVVPEGSSALPSALPSVLPLAKKLPVIAPPPLPSVSAAALPKLVPVAQALAPQALAPQALAASAAPPQALAAPLAGPLVLKKKVQAVQAEAQEVEGEAPTQSEQDAYKADVNSAEKFFKKAEGQWSEDYKEIERKALAMPAERQAVVEESRRLHAQAEAARAQGAQAQAPAAQAQAQGAEDVFGADAEQLEGSEPTFQKGGDDRNIILTSDQKVLLISLRKEKVISSLQTIMKSVAVDCELNFDDNDDGSYKCLALDESISQAAYHPILEKDIKETRDRYKVQVLAAPLQAEVKPALAESSALEVAVAPQVKPAFRRFKIKKVPHLYTEKKNASGNTTALIVYADEDTELKEPVGYLKINPETKLPTGHVQPIPEGFFD